MSKQSLAYFLKIYLCERPLFLSLIRAKEACLFQKYIPLKHPVLDVGCGDGFFAKIAFGEKLKIKNEKLKIKENIIDVGLDLRDSRITKVEESGIYNKLVTYHGNNIPFPDDSYKTVVSNCVLEHISNLQLTLKEIFRVLEPGGMFLTTVMAKPWENNLFGTKIFGESYKIWMRKTQKHFNLLTRQEWDNSFKSTGFKINQSTGYLSPPACRLIDICHYISFPNLVTYKLFGKWVLFPDLVKILPLNYFSDILSASCDLDDAGGIFYALKK